MTVLASDDFNRANSSDLGANWDPCTGEETPGGLKIAGNAAVCSSLSGDASETYNAVEWPDNQYSEAVLGTVDSGSASKGCGVTCRAATGSTKTYYRLTGEGAGWMVGKKVAGAWTQLASDTSPTFATSDKLRLTLDGTNWLAQKNGVTVTGGSGTDNSIASGRAGIAYSSTESIEVGIQSWEGGDLESGYPNIHKTYGWARF